MFIAFSKALSLVLKKQLVQLLVYASQLLVTLLQPPGAGSVHVQWEEVWYRSQMPMKPSGRHVRVPGGFIGCDRATRRRRGNYASAVTTARWLLSLGLPRGLYVPFEDRGTGATYIALRERHGSTRVMGADGALVDVKLDSPTRAITLFCSE